jgi:cobalt/nickel transport system permease protein
MPDLLTTPLFAVHISDGVLTEPWLIGGFVGAGLLAMLGAWRIRDEEIPQTALLTAAFFVISLIHVRVWPTSVHLLFNGLLGVVLGRRSGLAIPIGLFLQVVLLQHGGYTTLGINSCVMGLPALMSWGIFAACRRVCWRRVPWLRAGIVIFSVFVWGLSLVFGVALVCSNTAGRVSQVDPRWAESSALHPATLMGALLLGVGAAWGERHLEHAPEFPLGLLIGVTSVLATALLNCAVLVFGGREDWPSLVLLVLVPHIVIALIEGVVLGFVLGFLARVKPEIIGWSAAENGKCVSDPPS